MYLLPGGSILGVSGVYNNNGRTYVIGQGYEIRNLQYIDILLNQGNRIVILARKINICIRPLSGC